MSKYLFIAAFLAGSITSCTNSDVASNPSAIRNGTPSTDDAVVMLALNGDFFCTGSVISPHVILTASHCVVEPGVLTVLTGPTFAGAKDHAFTVRSAMAHADYDSSLSIDTAHDVAVVITDLPLPAKPLRLNRKLLDSSWIGRPVRFVGYGETICRDGTGVGVRRQTIAALESVGDTLRFVNKESGIAHGDSGGPSLMEIDGEETIVGVASYEVSGCEETYEAPVDIHADSFLQPIIDQYDPPPPVEPVDAATMAMGMTCQSGTQCLSGLCVKNGGRGFCTTPCKPSQPSTCPNDAVCQSLAGGNYCVPTALPKGACSFAGHGSNPDWGATGIALAFVIGIAWRRRRFSSELV